MLIKYSFQNTRVCKDSGGKEPWISALMNLHAINFMHEHTLVMISGKTTVIRHILTQPSNI